MNVRPLTSYSELLEGVECWNAMFPTLAFDRQVARQRLLMPAPGVDVHAWGGYTSGSLTGVLVTKHLTEPRAGYDERVGWISLLAVDPDHIPLRPGLVALLERAIEWFNDRGVTHVTLGGDIKKFVPGLPRQAPDEYRAALDQVGFDAGGLISDLYRALDDPLVDGLVERHGSPAGEVTIRAARQSDESALREFVRREFPGRWAYQVTSNCRLPGAIDDYWLVAAGDEPIAFARTGDTDSTVLSACVNWVDRWGPAYCGLGPIGVAKDHRGSGYGLALIAQVMAEFSARGHRHMTIDGVADGLLDYYAKLGFKPTISFERYTYDLDGSG